jgi:hypothetical protein
MTPFEFGVKVAEAVGAAPAIKPAVKPAAPIKPPTVPPVTPAAAKPPQTVKFLSRQDAVAMGDKAREKGFGGHVAEGFVHDPKDWEFHSQPSQAMQDMQTRDQAELARRRNTPSKPIPHNPELERVRDNFAKLHPQFHPGEIQDMVQLVVQNRGGDLAQFINNGNTRIKQHPTSAYNYAPPAPSESKPMMSKDPKQQAIFEKFRRELDAIDAGR